MRSNYFWSPDSKEIVFLHMDETKVPTYPITDWMPTHPNVENEKYPKVGDPNPVVKLGVVDADKGKVRWISLTSDEESYIPRFGWVQRGSDLGCAGEPDGGQDGDVSSSTRRPASREWC